VCTGKGTKGGGSGCRLCCRNIRFWIQPRAKGGPIVDRFRANNRLGISICDYGAWRKGFPFGIARPAKVAVRKPSALCSNLAGGDVSPTSDAAGSVVRTAAQRVVTGP
jgi:hypothetical protein